jgi:hypothetical protein
MLIFKERSSGNLKFGIKSDQELFITEINSD